MQRNGSPEHWPANGSGAGPEAFGASRIVGPGLPDPLVPGPRPSLRQPAPSPQTTNGHARQEVSEGRGGSRCEPVSDALRDEAGREPPSEAVQVGRRLLLVTLGAVVVVPGLMVLLAMLGVEVPPTMALALLGLIGIGAVVSAARADDRPKRARRFDEEDEGQPVGCCPGPRPLRSARRR